MIIPRASLIAFTFAFALCSTGCGFSIWPWGKRENSAATEPKRETKQEKCARLVRQLCDAAVSIRRLDMLELEGAAIVAARGGGPNASTIVAGRASRAGQSASLTYVAALNALTMCSPGSVDTQIRDFAYADKQKHRLLVESKPLIINHLKRSRLKLPLLPENCAQDLQALRYID